MQLSAIIYIRRYECHVREMREGIKDEALGVLCCFALFVCLTLLASFFLPSHLSLAFCYSHSLVYICNLKLNVLTYKVA